MKTHCVSALRPFGFGFEDLLFTLSTSISYKHYITRMITRKGTFRSALLTYYPRVLHDGSTRINAA